MDIRGRGREREGTRSGTHRERLPSSSDSGNFIFKDININKSWQSDDERSCLIKCFKSRQLDSYIVIKQRLFSKSYLYWLWPPLGLGRQRGRDNWITASLVSLLNKVAPSLPSSWWLYSVVKQTRCLLRCPVNVLITVFSWLRLYNGRLLGAGNWMKSPECKIVFLLIWLYHCRHHLSWRIIGFK